MMCVCVLHVNRHNVVHFYTPTLLPYCSPHTSNSRTLSICCIYTALSNPYKFSNTNRTHIRSLSCPRTLLLILLLLLLHLLLLLLLLLPLLLFLLYLLLLCHHLLLLPQWEVTTMAGMWNTLSAGLQIVQNKLDHVLESETTGEEKEEVSEYIVMLYQAFLSQCLERKGR